MATSKLKKKTASAQVSNKNELMDIVKEAFQQKNCKVVDCREVGLEGATKFTLFVRSDKADCKISFVSKPDKKSPYYSAVDEALGEKLCDDEEQ